MKKILVTLTTTNSSWREKIEEIKNLELKEIALFLTGLNGQEREECYRALAKTGLEKIPFVHLRSNMSAEEIRFLIKNYQTEVFNIHSEREFPLKDDLSFWANRIYLENTDLLLAEEELKKLGGNLFGPFPFGR